MYRREVFYCEFCGCEFSNKNDCEKHEIEHIQNFSQKSNKEISDNLFHLYSVADIYGIGKSVMGMPVENFKRLLRTAAERLRKAEDEDE